MIRSFACREAELIFNRERSKKLPQDIQQVARRKLVYLHEAVSLRDLRVPPGNRLESLLGRRKGQHCIRVNDQWRICFQWSAAGAFNVEIVDYH